MSLFILKNNGMPTPFEELDFWKWLETSRETWVLIDERKRYLNSLGFVYGVNTLSEDDITVLKCAFEYYYLYCENLIPLKDITIESVVLALKIGKTVTCYGNPVKAEGTNYTWQTPTLWVMLSNGASYKVNWKDLQNVVIL